MNKLNQSDLDALIDIKNGARYFKKGISKSIFRGQDLSGLDFRNLVFDELDFSFSNLSGANFAGNHLSDTYFDGANLSGADFTGCNFTYTSFEGADLSFVNLVESDLSGVYFSENTNLYKTKFPNFFVPFLFEREGKHHSKYFFEMSMGEKSLEWNIRKDYYYYVTYLSDIDDDKLLFIIFKYISLFDESQYGLPISNEDFKKHIESLILQNNSSL